jgi:hypothetical protein
MYTFSVKAIADGHLVEATWWNEYPLARNAMTDVIDTYGDAITMVELWRRDSLVDTIEVAA